MDGAPRLSLVVIRAADVTCSRQFYEALLAVEFVAERHGTGPEHLAADLGGTVLEIYPASVNRPPEPVRLGFRVASLDAALTAVETQNTEILSRPSESPGGRRAVVRDPDGRAVELTE